MNFNKLIDAYLEVQQDKKSIAAKKRLCTKFIRPRIGSLKTDSLAFGHIHEIKKSLEKTPIQANRVLAELQSIVSFGMKLGLVPLGTNLVALVSRYKERPRQRYMTKAEAASIFADLDYYSETRPQSVLFLWMLIYSGARPAEIAAATWGNVKLDWVTDETGNETLRGSLVIPEHKTDGYDVLRVVYLPTKIVRMLVVQNETGSVPEDKIFSIATPRRLWEKIRKRAGCTDLRLYDLRHTFATMVIESGGDLSDVALLFQHSSTQTSKRYGHLTATRGYELANNAAAALDRLASGD